MNDFKLKLMQVIKDECQFYKHKIRIDIKEHMIKLINKLNIRFTNHLKILNNVILRFKFTPLKDKTYHLVKKLITKYEKSTTEILINYIEFIKDIQTETNKYQNQTIQQLYNIFNNPITNTKKIRLSLKILNNNSENMNNICNKMKMKYLKNKKYSKHVIIQDFCT